MVFLFRIEAERERYYWKRQNQYGGDNE